MKGMTKKRVLWCLALLVTAALAIPARVSAQDMCDTDCGAELGDCRGGCIASFGDAEWRVRTTCLHSCDAGYFSCKELFRQYCAMTVLFRQKAGVPPAPVRAFRPPCVASGSQAHANPKCPSGSGAAPGKPGARPRSVAGGTAFRNRSRPTTPSPAVKSTS